MNLLKCPAMRGIFLSPFKMQSSIFCARASGPARGVTECF
jgi:hypothetical protein